MPDQTSNSKLILTFFLSLSKKGHVAFSTHIVKCESNLTACVRWKKEKAAILTWARRETSYVWSGAVISILKSFRRRPLKVPPRSELEKALFVAVVANRKKNCFSGPVSQAPTYASRRRRRRKKRRRKKKRRRRRKIRRRRTKRRRKKRRRKKRRRRKRSLQLCLDKCQKIASFTIISHLSWCDCTTNF